MRALRGLALAGLCWRWWMIAAALELALALPPALLWHEWLRGALASGYAPGGSSRTSRRTFASTSAHHRATGLPPARLGFAALVAMLLGIFFAGGWAEPPSMAGGQAGRARRLGARRSSGVTCVWLVTLVLLAPGPGCSTGRGSSC
jgi:hypothetical protein